jgi:hypothetical protein
MRKQRHTIGIKDPPVPKTDTQTESLDKAISFDQKGSMHSL